MFLVFGTLWTGVASYYASKIRPLSGFEDFLRPDNRIQRAFTLGNEAFPSNPSDQMITISLFWGVSGLNKRGIS